MPWQPAILEYDDRRANNPTQDTLNRLLKPFRLKPTLARIGDPKDRHAA